MLFQHVELWDVSVWVFVNILIPVLGPLGILWVLMKIPASASFVGSLATYKSIGKGELLWAALAMAAATIYELQSLESLLPPRSLESRATTAVTWLHLLLMFPAVLVVGVGSAGTPSTAMVIPEIPDPLVFKISVWSLVFVACTYTATHALLNEQEAKRVVMQQRSVEEATNHKNAILNHISDCLTRAPDARINCIERIK